MNKIVKVAIGVVVFISGFYLFSLYPKYTVPILTYHSFDDGKGLLSVSAKNFERQMQYLSNKHYNVISFGELVEGLINKRSFARNTVVITIDDGYENNFTVAYPVLKKYGFPALIFLITNNIDTGEGFLRWDEITKMCKHNISFGGHTRNHIYLPSISNENILWDEISGCKKVIEEHIGMSVDYFCYPLGGFTKKAEMVVIKAGYKAACVTNRGGDKLDSNNVYELNRISVRSSNPYFSFSNLLDPIRFRAKLSGYYNFWRARKEGD